VNEIYEIIRSLMHSNIKPRYHEANSWEAEKTLADISKATALGWKPKTSLQEGLRASVEFIKKEMA
jgi:nucleoside-diphosphate-sugar epimerase